MLTWHDRLAEWSSWGWPLSATHLWQATLVSMLIWAAIWLFNREHPQLRYALWLMAAAKFMFPVAVGSLVLRLIGIGNQQSLVESFFVVFEPIANPLRHIDRQAVITPSTGHNEFFCVLTIVWMLGVLLLFGVKLRRRWLFARVLRAESCMESGRETMAVRRAQSWLKIKTEIEFVVSAEISEPGVWRLWRPVIVFPEGMAERLTDEELEAVVAHELIHVRRRDNLIGTVQMWLCCLLWFHPLIWLIDRRLTNERELICDQEVLKCTGAPQVYASSLWKVAKFGFGWPVAGVSLMTNSNLRRRVEEMLAKQDDGSTRLRRVITTLGVSAVVVFWMVTGLSTTEIASAHYQDRAAAKAGAGEQELWTGEVVDIKSVTSKPKILHHESAHYPLEARLNRTEGTVVLSCVLAADGQIRDIRVIEELPDGLTESAMEAAELVRFVPAMRNGIPVSVRITVEFVFRIPSPPIKSYPEELGS